MSKNNINKSKPKRLGSLIIFFIFGMNVLCPLPLAQAQTVLNLPVPGTMVNATAVFVPPLLKGMMINADNPLQFDFILDTGHTNLQGTEITAESNRLIRYFLAALTIPEDEQWVNLSPFEKDRVIPDGFGVTEMGRDLLAQDYLLKQFTSSLMDPEDDLGKEFWERVYKKAYELYGTSSIPVNTFNKVWIIPEEAVVFAEDNITFVLKSRLKVLLEQDYVALRSANDSSYTPKQSKQAGILQNKALREMATPIIHDLLLPEIEKEVNEGRNFATLRQIYHAVILAKWYKENLKQSLLNKKYSDQGKITGIEVADKEIKQKIYRQYLAAFKKGVYNLIKEEYDEQTQAMIPRKYFLGGSSMEVDVAMTADRAQLSRYKREGDLIQLSSLMRKAGAGAGSEESVSDAGPDPAMLSQEEQAERLGVAARLVWHSNVPAYKLETIFLMTISALEKINRFVYDKEKVVIPGIISLQDMLTNQWVMETNEPKNLMATVGWQMGALRDESRERLITDVNKVKERLALFQDFEAMVREQYGRYKGIEAEYLLSRQENFKDNINRIHTGFNDALEFISWFNRFSRGEIKEGQHHFLDLLELSIKELKGSGQEALDIDFPGGIEFKLMEILGDGQGLKLSFARFFSNGFHRKLKLQVEYKKLAEVVRIIIKNNPETPGIKITDALLQKDASGKQNIFNVGVKGPDGRTGLGMAVSSKILADHGINITAMNDKDGTGARFEIDIPYSRIAEKESTDKAMLVDRVEVKKQVEYVNEMMGIFGGFITDRESKIEDDMLMRGSPVLGALWYMFYLTGVIEKKGVIEIGAGSYNQYLDYYRGNTEERSKAEQYINMRFLEILEEEGIKYLVSKHLQVRVPIGLTNEETRFEILPEEPADASTPGNWKDYVVGEIPLIKNDRIQFDDLKPMEDRLNHLKRKNAKLSERVTGMKINEMRYGLEKIGVDKIEGGEGLIIGFGMNLKELTLIAEDFRLKKVHAMDNGHDGNKTFVEEAAKQLANEGWDATKYRLYPDSFINMINVFDKNSLQVIYGSAMQPKMSEVEELARGLHEVLEPGGVVYLDSDGTYEDEWFALVDELEKYFGKNLYAYDAHIYQIVVSKPKDLGGIDFNPEFFDIQSQGRGIDIQLPANPQEWENIDIPGLIPYIFNITPINNLPSFLLGAGKPKVEEQLSLR